MAGKTVAAHMDERSAERLKSIAAAEGRPPSQLIAVATRMMTSFSPAARRALIALDGDSEAERLFASRLIGRAALKARERVIDGRHLGDYAAVTNQPLDSEEAIEAEAAAACRS